MPILILLLAIVVIVPLVLLVNLRPTFSPSEAASDSEIPDCRAGSITKLVCVEGATHEQLLDCNWTCVSTDEEKTGSSPAPGVLQCAQVNCPLSCISVTEADGCDACRCDVK